MSEFILNTDELPSTKLPPDVTLLLMEKLRRIEYRIPDGSQMYTHYLEVEAWGEKPGAWVVRYHGLHSVIGKDGLTSALRSMYAWLVENGVPLTAVEPS